jgi:hypothetical protein
MTLSARNWCDRNNMNYRLIDTRLSFAIDERQMTPAEAAIANRDLYLAGHRAYGWIEASRVGDDGKVLAAGASPAPRAPRPAPRPAPSGELIEALAAIGYTKAKARELAATAPAGTVAEQLAALFTKAAA